MSTHGSAPSLLHPLRDDRPLMRVFRSRHSALLIEVRGMTTFTTVALGQLDTSLVEQLQNVVERWLALAGDRLVTFHDWDGITDDFSGGIDLLRTLLPHRRRFAASHFLLRSPLARAQVLAGNVAFRGILHAHRWRPTFERGLTGSP
jgi:hypothetical protein